jgi:homoserine O-acetyltransferase
MIENEYYSEEIHGPHEYFGLGDFPLQTGFTLRGAKIAYKTHGTLNATKDNAILFPHMYSGTPMHMEMFIEEGRPLDPSKYFIILPGQFGNGFSSSPTNTPPPFNMGAFPNVTIADDVTAQHRLVTEKYGIKELHLVLGWSMGAAQAYEWAVRYPDMVKRAAAFAGTAKKTAHGQLISRQTGNAIKSDPAWNNGFYTEPNAVHVGLRRHAEAWALWGPSPAILNGEMWRTLGFNSLDDFVMGFLENWFLPMDPNNLLCMEWKDRHADVSAQTGSDLPAALGRIKAKTFVIPFSTDMLYPVKDMAAEQAMIPNSELRVIESIWGHWVMFCLTEEDKQNIDKILAEVLAT